MGTASRARVGRWIHQLAQDKTTGAIEMAILVTGAAGFIGFHVSQALLARGEQVIGVDNLNDYYDVTLKHARLAQLQANSQFSFHKLNIADREGMFAALADNPDITGVIHLAAQAGVRYSLTNPYAYIESNVMGQVVMLELARSFAKLKHFVYASSSSVYGGNTKLPFSVDDPVEQPVSLYAATKRTDELIGHTYAHLYTVCRKPACASLPFMARGGGQIWRLISSSRPFMRVSPLTCSITARCSATSPISTIL
jgi:nucleoside-diphosphate-sugar epimerase